MHRSGEISRSGAKEFDRLQKVVRHQRHHRVQLEVPARSAPADRRIVADHLRADHQHAFGDHRIHLARHDARSGLDLGQLQLAEAAARAGAQPANVVGDLRQRHRVGLECAAEKHDRVAGGLRFEMILSFAEGQPGLARQ